MTSKEKTDAALSLLQILLSWPLALIIVIVAIHEQLPGMADRIKSIGPEGIELEQRVEKLEETQQTIQEQVQDLSCQLSEQQTPSSGESDPERIAPERVPQQGRRMSPEQEAALAEQLTQFSAYLTAIGFPSPPASPFTVRVIVRDTSQARPITILDSERNFLCLTISRAQFSTYEDSALLTYAGRALLVARTHETRRIPDRIGVLNGLALYYVASFTGDPRVGDVSLDQPQTSDEPVLRAAQAWARAFWQLRALLEPERTDRLLFSVWTDPNISLDDPSEFVESLLASVEGTEGVTVAAQARAIFVESGVLEIAQATPQASPVIIR